MPGIGNIGLFGSPRILFGSHARLNKASDFNIIYNGQNICSQDSINYLGVTIDQTFSGDNIMIDDLVKKVTGRLNFLNFI